MWQDFGEENPIFRNTMEILSHDAGAEDDLSFFAGILLILILNGDMVGHFLHDWKFIQLKEPTKD